MSIEEIISRMEFVAHAIDGKKGAKVLCGSLDARAIREAVALLKANPDYKPSEPLTRDELRSRNKPVFVKVNGFTGGGYWCLCNYGYIMLPNGSGFWAKDRPSWELYDRPPKEERR